MSFDILMLGITDIILLATFVKIAVTWTRHHHFCPQPGLSSPPTSPLSLSFLDFLFLIELLF